MRNKPEGWRACGCTVEMWGEGHDDDLVLIKDEAQIHRQWCREGGRWYHTGVPQPEDQGPLTMEQVGGQPDTQGSAGI